MNDDVDIDNLLRVVRTLEARMQTLLDMKGQREREIENIDCEFNELVHARHTMMCGINAVKDNRPEPEEVRH